MSTPALPPLSLSELSKYINECSGWLAWASTWFSHHSTIKSISSSDLMAVRGLKSRVRAPSFTAHLEMSPVVSRLWRISANRKSVTIEMLYVLK
jgi:hypothetical protein